MGTVATLAIRVVAIVSDFEKQLASLENKWKRTGSQLQSIGSNLTQSVTLPIAAIGGAAIKSGLDFERAMNKINGVLRPTEDQMEQLRAVAMKMGADTIFSATDAATAMLELGKAGLNVQQSMGAVDEVLQLAAASGLSMGEAAEMSARTMSAFGLSIDDLAHTNDVLAAAVIGSTLEIQDLRTAFAYVGPIAQGFGMSLEEVTAALGLMRDSGIAAETTGRALREGMERLANPVKAVTDVMGQLGLGENAFKDSNGQLIGLSQIVGILESKGLTAAQSLKMFGDAAGPGMFALVTKGKGALDGFTQQLENSDGAAKRMADSMMQGLPGAFERLKGSIETALIAISGAMQPALIPLLGMLSALADVVTNQIVPAFQALPQPVQAGIVAMLGMAAAAGPIVFVIGKLFSTSSSLAAGWRILFGTVAKDGSRSMGLLSTAFGYVSTAVSFVVRHATALFPWLARIATAFGSWQAVIGAAARVLSLVTGPIGWIVGIAATLGAILWKVAGGWDGIKAAVTPVVKFLHDIGTIVVFLATNALVALWDKIKEVAGAFMDFAGAVGGAILDALTGLGQSLMSFGSTVLEFLLEPFKLVIDYISTTFPDEITAVVDFAKGILATARGWWDGFIAGAKEAAAWAAMAAGAIRNDNMPATPGAPTIAGKFTDPNGASFVEDYLSGKVDPFAGTAGALNARPAPRKTGTTAAKYEGLRLDTSDLMFGLALQEEAIANEMAFAQAMAAVEAFDLAALEAVYDSASRLDTTEFEAMANSLSIADDAAFELAQNLGKIEAMKWDDLIALGASFARLGGSIGGGVGDFIGGIGNIVGGFGAYKQNGGAPKGAMGKIGAVADMAGAIWGSTEAGGGAGMNALSGAMSGAATGMAFGPWGAAVGAGVGALVGFAKSRMVSQDEKDARESFKEWQDQILSMATAQQVAAAGGDKWAGMNMIVADSYHAIGKSTEEALADINRMLDATHISAGAVEHAAAVIASAMDEAAADQERLNSAIQRYGFEWEELGAKFRQTQLNTGAKELIEDWRVLVASGIAMETVNTRMAGSMNDYLKSAMTVGAEVPLAMQPILQSFADQGLLVDAAGNKITDLSAAGINFTETMAAGFDRVIIKLDQLINSLIAAGTAINPLDGGLVDGAGGGTQSKPGTYRDWVVYFEGQDGHASVTDMIKAAKNAAAGMPIPMAEGGIVRRPTFAMIGEAGPEAVVPLDANGGIPGGRGLVVNFNGPTFSSPREITTAIAAWYHDAIEHGGQARSDARRLGLVPA